MDRLEEAIDDVARRTGFSGAVRVDRAGEPEFAKAYGLADRAHGIPNTVDTLFAVASGSKSLTALAVISLIDDGKLTLETTARSVLGDDLPLIDDGVTVEHLLAHRSGIGDYLEEEEEPDISEYPVRVPVGELATTEQFLPVLDGYETAFPPGERFAYCNGGYVVLALIAERVGGDSFHDLVRRRVCEPAGMVDTEFLRSDELPGRAALGYLTADGPRTNIFHLPVRGTGDGGVYTTLADVTALWSAFFSGRIVPERWVAEMVRPRSDGPGEWKYGLGFWLHGTRTSVSLEGSDFGVSFRSMCAPSLEIRHTVVSNTPEGAWPVSDFLEERFGT